MVIEETGTADGLHESAQSPTVASPDGTVPPQRLQRRYGSNSHMKELSVNEQPN